MAFRCSKASLAGRTDAPHLGSHGLAEYGTLAVDPATVGKDAFDAVDAMC